MNKDPFKEYIKQSEPNKRDKGYAWHTAIGLQAVDGLKPSQYLIDIAIQNIEGEISIDEAQELLNSYYEENPKLDTEDRTEEADKVSVRIAKYLRTLGFDATNDIFAEHAWYFRNALVRANYNDLKNGIHETTEYLELFLRNLLLDEENELHNRAMHISGKFDLRSKADIEDEKADIRKRLKDIPTAVSEKTIRHIIVLFEKYGKEQIFSRSCVEEITGLKSTRASELLKILLENQVIEPVKGHGKGKYHFL